MNRLTLIVLLINFLVNVSCSQESLIINPQSKDYYNFNDIKTLADLGNYQVAILTDKIIFDAQYGRIETPLQYNNLYNEFNFNNIYKIRDALNNEYYFRFGWVSYIDGKSVFSQVNWIDEVSPPKNNSFVKFDFSVVDIRYIQFGNKTLCTIGDSQTWFSNAQNLRRLINEGNEDLIFIGSNTDIYGYGHEGEGGNTTTQLLDRINNIPLADYYTLLIGTNDFKDDIDLAYLNVLELLNYLTSFNPKAEIFYLTPLPTTNPARDDFNRQLFNRISSELKKKNNVTVLEVGGEMRKDENWDSVYFTSDGVHPNEAGVQLMAEIISKGIN